MSQIELKHIDVTFQQKKRTVHAVKDVSLTIEKVKSLRSWGCRGRVSQL